MRRAQEAGAAPAVGPKAMTTKAKVKPVPTKALPQHGRELPQAAGRELLPTDGKVTLRVVTDGKVTLRVPSKGGSQRLPRAGKETPRRLGDGKVTQRARAATIGLGPAGAPERALERLRKVSSGARASRARAKASGVLATSYLARELRRTRCWGKCWSGRANTVGLDRLSRCNMHRLIGEKERSLLASRTLSVRLNWYRVDCASFRYFQTRLGLVPRSVCRPDSAEMDETSRFC
mmetsp:Transcript_117013/g.277938  ORF Transcript_117013/g.277938 Transcript_117013/m.277938 type:complete len:234 (-) Transcript_117013:186-887(-)